MRRLEAQRNELNAKGSHQLTIALYVRLILFTNVNVALLLVRMLREELQLLQEQGSYVGEVVKAMDKKKVLVKVSGP